MRRLLLIGALLPFTSCPQNTYTINGTVVAKSTGKPLKHVNVIIIAVDNPKLRASYVTGEDGRFVFSNLPRAKFSFLAERQGGIMESFRENERYSTAIVTGPGLNSENITFPLTMLGAISGRINDEESEPVRDAQVMLFHRGVSSGKLQIQFQQTAETDSSGNYHFGQLMPGTYFIGVLARPWYAQNGPVTLGTPPPSQANGEFDVAYPITYYDGETAPNSASPIALSEGASMSVDLTLRAVPAIHVSIQNGNGFGLFATGPGGYTFQINGLVMGSESQQEITGIAPGRYVLQRQGGSKTVDLSGNFTVDAREIPESVLSGQLTFEGNERPADNVGIIFSSDRAKFQSQVAKDGSFGSHEAPAGRYDVGLANAPGYYVKSVLVGGRPSPDGKVDVTEGSATTISVIAAKGLSKIDGVALKDGAPFAGAMVLLVPKDLNRTSLIRRDQSDSDGTFTLPDVSPGPYILVGIDDGHDFAYAEPGALNAYLASGEALDVPLSNGFKPSVKVQHRQP